jgi:hypothetical protein
MTFAPVMWAVWSAVVVVMSILLIYRSRLARDEEGQIFLDESFDHEKNAQAAIVSRVNKVEPLVMMAKWAVAAMTGVLVVYYVRDILHHLNVV